LAGSLNTQLKQIGNSVPPIFAERLAEAVMQQIFGLDLGIEVLADNEKLSFDTRKTRKAKSTRAKRVNRPHTATAIQLNLFENTDANLLANLDLSLTQEYISETLFYYSSLKNRNPVKTLSFPPNGVEYLFRVKRSGKNASIFVLRHDGNTFIDTRILEYRLQFHYPIGDGLESIECILLSNQAEDISIAWDAIEDCLSKSSGYQTMMDVYGHFTEPHPIFDLTPKIVAKNPGFLLKFARQFSNFENNKNFYSSQFLQHLYGDDSTFDFIKIVKMLRNLRFDVRVNETNRTIPPGYFRCCYPFTLSLRKQISVKWKEVI
jgi:DNA (cytosine-5)-methyltransferase 1